MALLVREAAGPATAAPGDRAIYRVTKFNQPNPSEAQQAQVNWVVTCDGAELERRDNHGPLLDYRIPDDAADKTLLVMPYMNIPTPSVSVITLVQADAGQVLRNGLKKIRQDFAGLFESDPGAGLSDAELFDRVKNLGFTITDLLDSAEPLIPDGEDDGEPDRRLAIVVGHTLARPGARAVAPLDWHEYSFNTEIAALMMQAAEDRGIAARTFFRDGVGIAGAYRAAAAFEPKAIVELHFNSYSDPSVRGSETLYAVDVSNAHSQRLAEHMQRSLVEVFGRSGKADRGAKKVGPPDRGHTNVTAAPEVPSVIVEPFFGSNEQDSRLGRERMSQYAAGLVQAFDAFAEEIG